MCAFDDQIMPELQDRSAKLDATLTNLVSGQNYSLPHLGADIRPIQPEPHWRECSPRNLALILPVLAAVASEIDGTDKRVLRAIHNNGESQC